MYVYHGNQITVGELIKQLEECNNKKDHCGVFFDFCGFVPKPEVCSYRGFNEDVALVVDPTNQFPSNMTLQAFIKLLKDQIGQPCYGYKGGEYITQNETPVWVVVSRDSTGDTIITGVEDRDYMVIIKTDNV